MRQLPPTVRKAYVVENAAKFLCAFGTVELALEHRVRFGTGRDRGPTGYIQFKNAGAVAAVLDPANID